MPSTRVSGEGIAAVHSRSRLTAPLSRMTGDAFIDHWTSAGASEHGNEQLFRSELCDLPDVLPPDPAGPSDRRTRAQVVRVLTEQERRRT